MKISLNKNKVEDTEQGKNISSIFQNENKKSENPTLWFIN